MIPTHDGRMVATIRAIRGLGQKDLARMADLPDPYLSRFENGIMTLNARQVAQLEAALGVSLDAVRPVFEQFAAVAAPDCPGESASA